MNSNDLNIVHIVQSVRDNGPIRCFWAFVLERFLFHYKGMIHQKQYPYRNLAFSSKRDVQLRVLKRHSRWGICSTSNVIEPLLSESERIINENLFCKIGKNDF